MSASARVLAIAGVFLVWSIGVAQEIEARSFRLYDMGPALAEPYPLDVRPMAGASRMPSTPPPISRAVPPVPTMPSAPPPAPALSMPEKAAIPKPEPMAKPAATAGTSAAPVTPTPMTPPSASGSAMPAAGTAIPPAGAPAVKAEAPPPPRRTVSTAQRRARPVRGSGGGRRGGWYVFGAVGGGLPMDADYSSTTIDIESSYDAGFLFTGGGGYVWRNGVRADGEILYGTFNLDQVTVTRPGGLGVAAGTRDAEGNLSVLAVMANGAYDFDLGSAWRPYVMAGAGFAQVSLNDVTAGGAIVDDDAFAIAFQAGLGVNYEITDHWSVELGYRFFSTLDPELDDATATPFDSEVATHNLLFGSRYRF